MKIRDLHQGIVSFGKRIAVLSAAAWAFGTVTSQAQTSTLVFDNISNYRSGVSGAGGTATSSTPNTFMGDGYTLAAGTTAITGFDLYPLNTTGTNYTNLQITVYVWGSVNTTGTVNATTPAFSNLLASYTLTTTGNYTSGYYYSFESATPGASPGITLNTPLVLTSNTVGLTFNYQGSTNGTTYASANNLTSLISYGTAPTVGSLTLGGTTGGYYRNAASETNGNFTSTLRTLSGYTYQGEAVRVYGINPVAVPEPGTWALIVLGVGALLAWQVRRRTLITRH